MLSKIEIDKQRRFFFQKMEFTYKALKATALIENYQASKMLKILPKKALFASLRNTCIRTNRSRSVIKAFKLSRVVLHKNCKNNLFNYLQKASWLFKNFV